MRLLAWVLFVLGVFGVLVGTGLFLTLRRVAHWRDREARGLWRGMGRLDIDPAFIRSPEAREALGHLWRLDPSLAATTTDGLRRYEELSEAEPDALGDFRRFARWVVIAGYCAPLLAVAGGLALVASIRWLG